MPFCSRQRAISSLRGAGTLHVPASGDEIVSGYRSDTACPQAGQMRRTSAGRANQDSRRRSRTPLHATSRDYEASHRLPGGWPQPTGELQPGGVVGPSSGSGRASGIGTSCVPGNAPAAEHPGPSESHTPLRWATLQASQTGVPRGSAPGSSCTRSIKAGSRRRRGWEQQSKILASPRS